MAKIRMLPIATLLLLLIGGSSASARVNRQKDYLWKYMENEKHKLGGYTFDVHNTSFATAAKPTVLSCYYEVDKPPAEMVDAYLCTHVLLINYCDIDSNNHIFFPNASMVAKVMRLKTMNPQLKILLTITPNNRRLSTIVLDRNLTKIAVKSVASYLRANNFDGFDIDWEFPVWSSDAKPTDKNGLNTFLKALRRNFDKGPKKLLLTMATSAPWTITEKGYDIPTLNKYLDYVNIMNYDFHDFSWYEPFTGYNAPLFAKKFEVWLLKRLNTAYSTLYWVENGMDRSKILCGIPTYWRRYTLLFSFLHGPYAPAVGPGSSTDDPSYSVICEKQQGGMGGWKLEWDDEAMVPYMHKDRHWISYEDERSVALKAQWIKEQGFAGAMVFDIGCDDWKGSCSNNTFPLLKTIKRVLFSEDEDEDDII